jgi:hypothetical protein
MAVLTMPLLYTTEERGDEDAEEVMEEFTNKEFWGMKPPAKSALSGRNPLEPPSVLAAELSGFSL